MHYASLFAFYTVYFVMIGVSTFVSKYYGELGMSMGQIGMLTSIPTLMSFVFMPLIGAWTDRISKKRYLLSALVLLMAMMCLIISRFRAFAPLLALVSVHHVFSSSNRPLMDSISLEYTRTINRPFGPIRLMGTVGYQLGALLAGWLLKDSLGGLYPLMAASLLVSFFISFAMPNVEGHQYARQKVPLKHLFADPHVRALFIIVYLASITTQFYISFYAKYMGDLGFGNQEISLITLFSVAAELPFLVFADRLFPKRSVWQWLLLGYAANGVRWLGLAFARSVPLIIIFQIPGVTVMGCFEFFTALYLSRRVSKEQAGAAQSMLSLTIFGAGNITGVLLGGWICEFVSISTVFACNGIFLLLGAVALIPIVKKLTAEERCS